MERREFQKILADSLLNIVEVGIKRDILKKKKEKNLMIKL